MTNDIKKMIGDKALVLPLPTSARTYGGLLLPEIYRDNRLAPFGKIILLGDGTRFDNEVGKELCAHVTPWDVQVGAIVALSEHLDRPLLWQDVRYQLVYQHEIICEITGMVEDSL